MGARKEGGDSLQARWYHVGYSPASGKGAGVFVFQASEVFVQEGASDMSKPRVLSGVQPSGNLHIGNYLGAIRNWAAEQDQFENYFCVVDHHAITVPQDPDELRRRTISLTNAYLAAGLDPNKVTIFIQSHVPEHTELAWILNTFTYFGELRRMTQFKEKAGKRQEEVNVGLFDYPVLQAADIVLYKASLVPVGKDQKQHLEMTRDMAIKFNEAYGETLVVPEPVIREDVAVIPGLDGQKMSKSYGNTIEIFGDEKALRKKIMGIVMDSRTPAEIALMKTLKHALDPQNLLNPGKVL